MKASWKCRKCGAIGRDLFYVSKPSFCKKCISAYNKVRYDARDKNSPSISTANLEPDTCDAPLRAQATPRPDTPCRIHIRSLRHRLCDADGISAKAAIDGLVLCKVLQDDKAEFVEEVTYSQAKVPRNEQEETVITITW